MPFFKAQDMAGWTGGSWSQGPPGAVSGVSTDSRTISPGQLFVALKGERLDGHQFVRAAFARGASGAMVAREQAAGLASEGPLLCVADTRRGLPDLARGYRGTLSAGMVAVTGSVGKTTVKEMAADILAAAGPTARSYGNWNNDIGLPLSLLRMEPGDGFGVFELGMNHPGELTPLCEILRPAWAVVTAIGPVHLEFFDSVEAVAREKATVLKSLPPDGAAVLNRHEAWFDLLQESAPCRVVAVSMGEGDGADYVGRPGGEPGVLVVKERSAGGSFSYRMPLPGQYIMQDALQAIAVGRELGVPAEAAAAALADYVPPAMRWNRVTFDGVEVINDAYNANPLSMRAALATLAELPGPGRKWLVLGGMRELGAAERQEHFALGREIAYGNWAGLLVTGPLGTLIAEGAEAEGWQADRVTRCADAREAAQALRRRAAPGDMVLLKASRAEHIEDVLKHWGDQQVKEGKSADG